VWKSSKNGGLRKRRVKWKWPWSKYETINGIGWIIIRKKMENIIYICLELTEIIIFERNKRCT
jgi:hypothetical protein